MQSVPPPTTYRRVVTYSAALGLLAVIIASAALPPGLNLEIVVLAIFMALLSWLAYRYSSLREHEFDQKGVYRRRKLLFTWAAVKRISLSFAKHAHEVTLIAPPTFGAMLSGGAIQHTGWIDYGIKIVFSLEDGRSFSVPSNLNKLTQDRVIQRIDEFSKAVNPRITYDE